jgi:hypothetical protein
MLKLGALVQFCLLLGVKRTWLPHCRMSANDPKRTLRLVPRMHDPISVWKLESRLSQYPQQRDRRFRN